MKHHPQQGAALLEVACPDPPFPNASLWNLFPPWTEFFDRLKWLWYSWLSTLHQNWKTGFEFWSSHNEDFENDACGLSSLVLGFARCVRGNGSTRDTPKAVQNE